MLEHVKTGLAYAAAVYLSACVLYMLVTKYYCGVGTPLKDSFSEEQLRIKKDSASTRGGIFMAAVAVSVLVMVVFRPL